MAIEEFEFREKRKEKIPCSDCRSLVSRGNMINHKATKKHAEIMKINNTFKLKTQALINLIEKIVDNKIKK